MEISLNVLFKLFFIAIVVDIIAKVLVIVSSGNIKSKDVVGKLIESVGEIILLGSIYVLSVLIPELEPLLVLLAGGLALKEALSIKTSLTSLGVWTPDSLNTLMESSLDKLNKLDTTSPKKKE